ncbi:glycoside hydrolase family 28 protein [Niabella sp. CJ426]|uniref:glycoside hydrolase family 28 protein n=1 Tax=Niabella sp. CJ426 TaxID=3393740 RepID=UPI003D026B4E
MISGLYRILSFVIFMQFAVAANAGAYKVQERKTDSIPVKEQVGAAALPAEIAPVNAPFKMPQLKKPVFPARSILITENGAKEDSKVTGIIQQTIDQLNKQGGGKVIIPKGKWHTGRLTLLSNINLEIAEGAELYFSGEVEDYRPAVFTRNEGIEVMSLGACIYANGQRNIAITGKGKLIGPAKGGSVRKQIMTKDVIENVVAHTTPVAQRIYEGHNGDFIFPPMFISPINCNNVLIEGISLENTAFWNVAPVYCDSVIIRGITVHSVGIPRGDGIDIESSRNVLIEYCTLSTGDDAFTIKAGRGYDGLRVNRPTENVVVRNGLVLEGHGGITCGSETASMIRNLYVHDCVFENARSAIRFKTRRPRGGGGENLFYERIRINGSRYAFEWDMLGSATHVGTAASRYPPRDKDALTPVFRSIKAENIVIEKTTQFIKATAIPESPLENIRINKIQSNTEDLIAAADVQGLTISNSVLSVQQPVINLLDARNILFNKVTIISPSNTVQLKVEGPLSRQIRFKNSSPSRPIGWASNSWQKTASATK